MIGAEAATVRVTVAVPVPAELVAVIVNDVEGKAAVGVPLMTQVLSLMLRPEGKAAEALHMVIEAPLVCRFVGETDMTLPTDPLVPVASV